MFNKNIIYQSLLFIFVYLAIFFVCSWIYFFLGNTYADELGLTGQNVAKWSRADLISIFSGVGVFLAPVVVLWGFHTWKVQEKLKLRIEALRSFKRYIVQMYEQIYEFQKKEFYSDFRNGKQEIIKVNFNNFINNFTQLSLDLFSKMNNETAYFEETEIEEMVERINSLWLIIKNINDSKLIVETIEFSLPRESLLTGEEYEFEKNLYILDPYSTRLKKELQDPKIKEFLEEFSKDKLFKTLDEINLNIDNLLREIYK